MSYTETIIRGIIGVLALLFFCYLCSSNKKAINWSIVVKGLLIQLGFAICILHISIIETIFQGISNIFLSILDFTKEGSIFLFGETLVNNPSFGAIFAFQILPTIVFFSALTSLILSFRLDQSTKAAWSSLANSAVKIASFLVKHPAVLGRNAYSCLICSKK